MCCVSRRCAAMYDKVRNMEEWKFELKKQKEEVEEEVNPIIKLSNEGKLSCEQYLEELLRALERAKEKYCKRHGITKDEYDREEREEYI